MRDAGEVRSYQDLIVWQKAMELVERTYQMSGKLPVKKKLTPRP